MKSAPIVILVYNRPEHTRKCLDALMLNDGWKDSDVFIYCDGPKDPSDFNDKIEATRKIADGVKGCKSLKVIKSTTNKGLYNSVLEGVKEVVNNYGNIIVVEDDLVTAPAFLKFMNMSLEKYSDDKGIACISGYVYPLIGHIEQPFFIKGADCWGWATWKDRWNDLNTDATKLFSEIEKDKELQQEFTFNFSYPYMQMLSDRVAGLNQSWAILWYASSFLKNRLCLYPSVSLVKNIGNDGSGTHTFIPTDRFNSKESIGNELTLPEKIEESAAARKLFEKFFRSLKKPSGIIQIAKSFIPEGVKSSIKKIIKPARKSPWSGDYLSWEDAENNSSGYDSSLILEKVKQSVLRVKNGEAVYERDSVLFDTIEFSPDVLKLFESVLNENGELNVVDFGGSLGSTYFQYTKLLNTEKPIRWAVVEQKHFVDTGNAEIADDHLKFFYTAGESIIYASPEILILSSVLPYIEKPYPLLESLLNLNFKYIVIDRTPFINRSTDRLTVQEVPREIYLASYPSWFFSERKFKDYFSRRYTLIKEFDCKTDPKEYLGKDFTYRKGFILKKKDEA